MPTTDLLDKREGRVRRMFGEIAPCYDRLNHLLSLNIDRSWRRRAVRMLPAEGAAPILDLCTGTGDLALEFAKATGGTVPIVGSDFCHEMLTRAIAKRDRSRKRQRRTSEQETISEPEASATVSDSVANASGSDRIVTFLEADAQELPFPDDTFQMTTVAFGLRNVTDTDRGLAEMVRVTKPGGRVAVLEFSQPRHWFFGTMYRYYFRFLLPLIGQIFSRSKDNAYKYLPESVLEFPDGDALAEKMRTHGMEDVRFYPFTLGIATLYIGKKMTTS